MGVLRSDYPVVTITLQRWQKNWLNKQNAINFSGLVQEMMTELIRQRDPVYFEMNNQICDNNIQRKDLIKTIVKNHPEIMPVSNTSKY
jgi:shikimate kinase